MVLVVMRLWATGLQVHSYAAAEGGRSQANIATSGKERALSFVALIEVYYVGLLQNWVVTVGVIRHNHIRGGRCTIIDIKFNAILITSRNAVVLYDFVKHFLISFPSRVHGVFVEEFVCRAITRIWHRACFHVLIECISYLTVYHGCRIVVIW